MLGELLLPLVGVIAVVITVLGVCSWRHGTGCVDDDNDKNENDNAGGRVEAAAVDVAVATAVGDSDW